MYRTHNCGELRLSNLDETVTLAGWVQRVRDLGSMTFIDLRDRYGITQLMVNEDSDKELLSVVEDLGREFVIQVEGVVAERSSKNKNIPTGDIEILIKDIVVLNGSVNPPFTIEDNTDGGDELRMKYRYLDIRRNPVRKNLELRHKIGFHIRKYLDALDFLEIETPFLIKSTPEGARDFVVPSRVHPGEFYALPQSPQVFKQLLMVGGYDRYFQIVKCFRDEDLRADRQPEFTQIDCEMAFVNQDDILSTFEGLVKSLFKEIKGLDFSDDFPRMPYEEAMSKYGSDKPDIRFAMEINEISDIVKGKDFKVFDDAEYIGAINVTGAAVFTRRQIDQLTDYVRRPQIGATGLIFARHNEDGTIKSSVDKFFNEEELQKWSEKLNSKPGDLMLVMAGERSKTLNALGELRLHVADILELRDKDVFAPLWVVDFPLLEWDEETKRYYAMHHPFTSPKITDAHMLDVDPKNVRADAYDLVINGVEIGGGSIRIHDEVLQQKVFKTLGFTEEEANSQFGFLLNAFKYGAPPHGGVAFGFDRLVSLFAGIDSIRDVIAFPKNNAAKDLMIESPSPIHSDQLDELKIKLVKEEE